MQPFHGNPSPNQIGVWAANIGPERASRGWAYGSIRKAGGTLAFGSDWPVVTLDPRAGLHMAVNRTTPDGRPAGGWHVKERVSLAQALEAYTSGAAYASFDEQRKGRLEKGMLADIWSSSRPTSSRCRPRACSRRRSRTPSSTARSSSSAGRKHHRDPAADPLKRGAAQILSVAESLVDQGPVGRQEPDVQRHLAGGVRRAAQARVVGANDRLDAVQRPVRRVVSPSTKCFATCSTPRFIASVLCPVAMMRLAHVTSPSSLIR